MSIEIDQLVQKARVLQTILAAAFLFVPAACQAQESCPWLNAATAGGVLGGAATATVSRTNTELPGSSPANARSNAGPMSANPSGASYAKNAVDDADCAFVRRPGSIEGELRIEVRTMREPQKEFASYLARCGDQATPLKAIGNAAIVCALNAKRGRLSEQVVGRVRDRVFVIRLSTADSSVTQRLLRGKAQKVAESVAGNLF